MLKTAENCRILIVSFLYVIVIIIKYSANQETPEHE